LGWEGIGKESLGVVGFGRLLICSDLEKEKTGHAERSEASLPLHPSSSAKQ
jgi:hypothetical protein